MFGEACLSDGDDNVDGDDDYEYVETLEDDSDSGQRSLSFGVQRLPSFEIYEEKEIKARKDGMAFEVSELLGIGYHEATRLLQYFKWDKDASCEAWWTQNGPKLCTSIGITIHSHAGYINTTSVVTSSTQKMCLLCKRNPMSFTVPADLDETIPKKHSGALNTASTSACDVRRSHSSTYTGSKAVNRELKLLSKRLVPALLQYELPNEDSLLTVDVTIRCTGMWLGVEAPFRLTIPENYPFTFPTARCLSPGILFHPNIQPTDGSLCLRLLTSDGWKPVFTLADVCAGLQELFEEPNWNHALNDEAVSLYQNDRNAFLMKLAAIGAISSHLNDLLTIVKDEESTDHENELFPMHKLPSPARLRYKRKAPSKPTSVNDDIDSSNPEEAAPAKAFRHLQNETVGQNTTIADIMLVSPVMESQQGEVNSNNSSGESQTETVSVEDGIRETISLLCGHSFCRDCWTGVIEEAVDSGPDCVSLCCPAGKCNLVVPEELVAQFCPHKLARYEHYLIQSFVMRNDAASYCPAPDCSNIIEYPKRDKRRVISCSCGAKWCWGCRRDPHAPVSCALIDRWERKAEEFNEFFKQDHWVSMNVKACPGCHKRIWKDGGCMHVTCEAVRGGCGKEFCWLCLGDWSRHGSGTGGFYACNNFANAAKAGTLEGDLKRAYDAEMILEDSRSQTQRYEWHFDRHKFMERSMRAAEERGFPACAGSCAGCLAAQKDSADSTSSSSSKSLSVGGMPSPSDAVGGESSRPRTSPCRRGLITQQQEKIEQIIRPIIGQPPSEHAIATLEALPTANRALVSCRAALRWIYVAKYFLTQDGPTDLFQSNHDAFESCTERLNLLIEKDWGGYADSVRGGQSTRLQASSSPSVGVSNACLAQRADRGSNINAASIIRSEKRNDGTSPSTSSKLSWEDYYGSDCASAMELYDRLRKLRDVTQETLRFMTAMCEAPEFESIFGFW